MHSELSKFVSELQLKGVFVECLFSAIIIGLFFVYFAILAISVAGTAVMMMLGIHEVTNDSSFSTITFPLLEIVQLHQTHPNAVFQVLCRCFGFRSIRSADRRCQK
jgi:hypothetical protein